MLSITIVTLLITSNIIPRIQAEEQEERKAQFNGTQTPVYKSNSVIEALKVQKRDTLNIVPESYVEQTNHIDESPRGNRLRRDLPNSDNYMKDLNKKLSSHDTTSKRTGPVNYFGSRVYQSNNYYSGSDGQNILYGSHDVQIGNTYYSDNPNGINVYGPILVQENNTYRGKNKNALYGASVTQIGNKYPEHSGKNDIYTGVVVQTNNTYAENPGNKTFFGIIIHQSNNTYPKSIEANKDALKPIIYQSGNFYSSNNDTEAGMNKNKTKKKNNTESHVHSLEQNTTDSQGNSSSTNYDFDSSSHIENKTLYNKEKKAHADKHTEVNRQMSLSCNCYKQPKIPDSYAPRRCYMKPTAPVESYTTYKLSYLPVNGCKNLRGEARKPSPNLVQSCEPMESCTVQKLSFLPNPVCVTQAIRPCHHDMWGQGPMQNITTQRHDYVPKPCVLRESCKPPVKFHCTEQPFENRTINKLSYLPPERIELVKSFAPERCYERPAAKMDGSTTHKLSYMPNQILPKEPMPWACKGQYEKPCQKLEDNTTYTMSYLDAKSDCRRRAIIPNSCTNLVTASKRFETQTVYKNSYLPASAPIPQPIKPLPNLVPSTAQMEGDTVHKLSFLPNPVCVTQPIRPCHHDMWGQGPMQNITTQRHDYVPKPCAVRESCKPPQIYHYVEQPFENRTINRMSYLNPGRVPLPESYAPHRCYEKPSAKMESDTIQKMSYQPVCVPAPQRPVWACKGQYQKPCQKLEGTTVYRSSFLPPGEDCTEYVDPCSYGDCKPCYCSCPAECITTDPCACNFPRAECCT